MNNVIMESYENSEAYLLAIGWEWNSKEDYKEVKEKILSLLCEKKVSLANVQLLFGDILSDIRGYSPIAR